jgi:hypothetical protein
MDLEDRAYELSVSIGVENPPKAWLDWLVDQGDVDGWAGLDYGDFQAFMYDERIDAEVERRAV